MPLTDALDIPADLTLLLSRQALCDYALACEAAQDAAERCAAAKSPSADVFAQLRDRRERVLATEEALTVIGGEDATRHGADRSLASRHRDLTAMLIRTALYRLRGHLESSEEEILTTADRIQRLRALLDTLEQRPHPAPLCLASDLDDEE